MKTISFLWNFRILFIVFFVFTSCDKNEDTDTTDLELYNLAKATEGFTWYKNSDALLDKSIGSGHSQPFLRTRYNSIAATQLDTLGKVIAGTDFTEGSLIVKQLYGNQTTLEMYAILYKQSKNSNADANGWVWGYVNANGTVAEPSANKGAGCISCHGQSNNVDYTLMNKYFP
ncbi:MAG: cytochrome P460 family protein [Salinivirgaceae bacterium]|nr:cytochrome P460 family protein [Salinivirgaceae bacterium]